jgi:hypothetical protein
MRYSSLRKCGSDGKAIQRVKTETAGAKRVLMDRQVPSDRDPLMQGEREKADASRHAGPVKSAETVRDSDSASGHQADVNRGAERVEAVKAKLQSRRDSDASRDLGRADMGKSCAECQAERAASMGHRGIMLFDETLQPEDGHTGTDPIFLTIRACLLGQSKSPGHEQDHKDDEK